VLVGAARVHLRERFLAADAALTGANFAIASTGGVVVCTNEGNADLGIALAPIHIESIGIEKLVPGPQELAVFLRLLARSGTGQRATVYTTHVHAPERGRQVHFVLVDNGRTRQLARDDFWRSLKCIRCGACMNTCPVYRRSGGYSYGSTVPGPIGAVLAPGIDLQKYASLPFASTLCGSCTAVCPVKIDLDAQLLRWRELIVAAGASTSIMKRVMARGGRFVLSSPRLFGLAGKLLRTLLRHSPNRVLKRMSSGWSGERDLPAAPAETFREWYARSRGEGRK
jgi:L-lactate dehydrogenase complex protein LldF